MAIDVDSLDELAQRIESLPGQPRTRSADLIARLQPVLDAALARGLPLDALMPLLREAGIALQPRTVRDYLSRARRGGTTPSPAASSAQRAAPPAPPPTTTGSREEVAAARTAAARTAPADTPLPGRFTLVPDTENIRPKDRFHMPDQAQQIEPAALKIYWVGGAKGGVGKSLACMAYLDYLLLLGRTPLLIETDTSNPDCAKSYGKTVDTELLDLDSRDGWLALLTLCEQSPRTIVINTGSRNSNSVTQYAKLFALGLDELGAELQTLWVINEHRDSLELLRQFRSALPSARVHVLRNAHCASAFPLYDESQLRKEIESAGGKSLTLPDLASRVTRDLYERRLTLQAAICQLPFGSRIELKRWRSEVAEVFAQVVT